MHICFLTTGNIRHIATMKRALGLANHMADLGWHVSIVALDCPDNREQLSRTCDARIDVRFFSASNPIMEVMRKTKVVESLTPDVLYLCSYSFRNRIWHTTKTRGLRMVVEHSELFSSIKGAPLAKRLLAAYFEERSLRVSDDIICASRFLTSHFTERSIRRVVRKPKIHYLPYAFAETLLSDPPIALPNLLAMHGDRFNLVYIGSLIREYGLFIMLEALRMLKDAKPSIRLHLLGSGPDEQAARLYVQSHGMEDLVHFAGYVPEPDLSSWFRLAGAFLVPLFDTVQDQARCPSKTYMYLAFQKPVITCCIGESAVLFDDPRLFFRPGDAEDLSKRIMDIASNPTCNLPSSSNHSWLERARSLTHMLLPENGK